MDPKYGTITTEHKDIPPDEPVFLLRGQDVLATLALAGYACLLRAHGKFEMADKVDEQRARMNAWAPTKLPD